jgi:putative transposase
VTDEAVIELAPQLGVRGACDAVGCAQVGCYRRHRQSPPPAPKTPIPQRDRVQPRALSQAEQQAILDTLHSDRFVDLAPAEVWATLLDEDVYLGSISTFYRLLRQAGESRERLPQAIHAATVKPELVACQPNSVWSWDITKLRGPAKWSYYYYYYHLYVILDIFSRYVVGWMVASRESAAPAEVVIRQTCAKHLAPSSKRCTHRWCGWPAAMFTQRWSRTQSKTHGSPWCGPSVSSKGARASARRSCVSSSTECAA